MVCDGGSATGALRRGRFDTGASTRAIQYLHAVIAQVQSQPSNTQSDTPAPSKLRRGAHETRPQRSSYGHVRTATLQRRKSHCAALRSVLQRHLSSGAIPESQSSATPPRGPRRIRLSRPRRSTSARILGCDQRFKLTPYACSSTLGRKQAGDENRRKQTDKLSIDMRPLY